jgi:nicotinamidase-related amidase
MDRKTIIAILALLTAGAGLLWADAGLRIPVRSRTNGVVRVSELTWDPARTAVIICDMWDQHWCPPATARVAELAPAINDFVSVARERGMLIVHAPSDTMSFYRASPARLAAINAPKAPDLPKDMRKANKALNAAERADRPIDDLGGGCTCKDAHSHRAWKRQIDTIAIDESRDLISDSGAEMWNVFASRGIDNVILVGVHTNMCVVGRSFGLRNWVANGKNALLIRDLTDSMYNPERRPYVDHFTGTELYIHHIEEFICPTATSSALTNKPAFRFKEDTRLEVESTDSSPPGGANP